MVQLPVCMEEAKESGKTFFIELYAIKLRTTTLYLAACDEDIIYDGTRFIAVPIQRESVTRSMDNITDSCQLTISDVNYQLLAYVVNGFDFRGSLATVIRIQYPDSLDDPKVFEWVYTGTVDEPSFAEGTFSCKLQTVFPQVQCPNRCYQLACNSEFGDAECCYVPNTAAVKVVAASGNYLAFDTWFDENYWKNGVVSIAGESRVIEASAANVVMLNVNFLQENILGKDATLKQGCDKSRERCAYYRNTIHYGGFPAIPFESVWR